MILDVRSGTQSCPHPATSGANGIRDEEVRFPPGVVHFHATPDPWIRQRGPEVCRPWVFYQLETAIEVGGPGTKAEVSGPFSEP